MSTGSSMDPFEFARVAGHDLAASPDGGTITSDAGALPVEHADATLVGQRIHGLALATLP